MRRLVRQVPAVLAALAVFPMLSLVLRRGVEVPFWDEWAWADFSYALHKQSLTFAQLWEPHAEHRIFGDNLLMVVLDMVGGWSVVREQVLSLMMVAATQLVLWRLIRRTVPYAWQGIAVLSATVLLFGLAQYENFQWGYQMAWFACNLGLVIAVAALTKPGTGAARRNFLIALVAAVAASVTGSQGLLVWIVGALVIGMVRPRGSLARLVGWLLCGVVTVAVVRAGAWNGDPAGQAGLQQVGTVIGFTLAYLGAPLAGTIGVVPSVEAGVVVLLLLAGLAVASVRGPLSLRIRLAPWLAFAAYAVGNGVLTAHARGGSGLGVALSSRYTTIGSLAWIALVGGACIALPQLRTAARTAQFAIAALLAAVVVSSLHESRVLSPVWSWHAVQMREARAELARGDPRGIRLINPDVRFVTVKMGWLAEVRDGLFSGR